MAVSFDVVGAAGQTWITRKRRSSMRWRLTHRRDEVPFTPPGHKQGRSPDPRVLAVLQVYAHSLNGDDYDDEPKGP
jgi:hypothetical protein